MNTSVINNMSNIAGVVIRESKYAVNETIDRLQAFLEQHGITIYLRIDQQQELQKVGQAVSPIEALLFGNPKVGGPVMVENPLAALDLPLKVVAWQDEHGIVRLAYYEAEYIKNRYSLSSAVSAPLNINALISEVLS